MQNFWRTLIVLVAMVTAGLLQARLAQVGLAAETSSTPHARPPHWIWSKEPASAAEIRLERSLSLDRSIQSGELSFAADFCTARVEINGRRVLEVAPYCQRQTLDVTAWLK